MIAQGVPSGEGIPAFEGTAKRGPSFQASTRARHRPRTCSGDRHGGQPKQNALLAKEMDTRVKPAYELNEIETFKRATWSRRSRLKSISYRRASRTIGKPRRAKSRPTSIGKRWRGL